MNCYHARQLISPYLDARLSGREILALQDHLAACGSCERERQSLRQVKMLLRGLGEPHPPMGFSEAVRRRLEQPEPETLRWRVLLPTPPAKPQRGRRLATALALSCFTMLSVVAPFAPDAGSVVRSSASLLGSRFEAPGSSDALLSNALAGLHSPEPATFSPVGDPAFAGVEAAPMQAPLQNPWQTASFSSGLAAPMRSSDISFGSVRFAAFHTR